VEHNRQLTPRDPRVASATRPRTQPARDTSSRIIPIRRSRSSPLCCSKYSRQCSVSAVSVRGLGGEPMQSFAYPKATRGPRPRTRHSLMHTHSSDAYALLGCICTPRMHMRPLDAYALFDAHAPLGCICTPRMHMRPSDAHALLGCTCAPRGRICMCAAPVLLVCASAPHLASHLSRPRLHEQAVQGAGCRVQGAGCRVQGTGYTPPQHLMLRLTRGARPREGAGCRAQGAGHAALLT